MVINDYQKCSLKKSHHILVILHIRYHFRVVALELHPWILIPQDVVNSIRPIIVLSEHDIADESLSHVLSKRGHIALTISIELVHYMPACLRAQDLVSHVRDEIKAVFELVHSCRISRPNLEALIWREIQFILLFIV